jgi:hypothetical protein
MLVCRNERSIEEAEEILKNSAEWLESDLSLRLTNAPIPLKEAKAE